MGVAAALVGHAWGGISEDNPNCVRRAARITQATLSYTQDYDEKFPATADPPRFRQDIAPYLPENYPQTCPATGGFYVPNPAIQFISQAALANVYTTEVLRDPAPHADGLNTVTFADGHAERGGVFQGGDPNRFCQMRARIATLALLMYVQDYDDTFPPAGSAAELRPLLAPYAGAERNLDCPATDLPFVPNAALSGRSLSDLDTEEWGRVETFRDAAPHPNGVSTVAFLDRHVERDGVENFPDRDKECDDRLTALDTAFAQYAQDYDDTFPPSVEPVALRSSLGPYLRGRVDSALECPETGLTYRFNAAVAGRVEFTLPAGTELVREAAPHRTTHLKAITQSVFGFFNLSDARLRWTPLALTTAATNGDAPGGASRLLWLRDDAAVAAVRRVSADLSPLGTPTALMAPRPPAQDPYWEYQYYFPASLVVTPSGTGRLLWTGTPYLYPTVYPYLALLEPPLPLVVNTLDPATVAADATVPVPPFAGWLPRAFAAGPGGTTWQLWAAEDGARATVTEPVPFTRKTAAAKTRVLSLGPGWRAADLAVRGGDVWEILWTRRDGAAALMEASPNTTVVRSVTLGPDPGWTAVAVASGAPDGRAWVLWRDRAGAARLQPVAPGPEVTQAAVPVPALPDSAIPAGVSVGGDGLLRVWGTRTSDGAAVVALLAPTGEVVGGRVILPPD
jgi:prepilin-type processing-associated H-X9-DG protein